MLGMITDILSSGTQTAVVGAHENDRTNVVDTSRGDQAHRVML